jgi:Amt family ammonium transporter
LPRPFPAIISGGIAERARFWPQLIATAVIVGFVYPFFEGIAWNQHFGVQAWIKATTGEEFHDFAGSWWCTPWAAGLPCPR